VLTVKNIALMDRISINVYLMRLERSGLCVAKMIILLLTMKAHPRKNITSRIMLMMLLPGLMRYARASPLVPGIAAKIVLIGSISWYLLVLLAAYSYPRRERRHTT